MADIIKFLGGNITYLIGILAALIVLIVILFVVQRKLKKKIVVKEEIKEKESEYAIQLRNLKNSTKPSEEMLNKLNTLTRNYFIEEFQVKRGLDYAELAEIFGKNNKRDFQEFCQKMLTAIYSDVGINKNKLMGLIRNLETLIAKQPPRIRNEELFPGSINKKEKVIDKIFLKFSNEANLNNIEEIEDKEIRKAYDELKELFKIIYEKAEKADDDEVLVELSKLRINLIEKINEYLKNPLNKETKKFLKEMLKSYKYLISLQ